MVIVGLPPFFVYDDIAVFDVRARVGVESE
jgi:hypothetical protein